MTEPPCARVLVCARKLVVITPATGCVSQRTAVTPLASSLHSLLSPFCADALDRGDDDDSAGGGDGKDPKKGRDEFFNLTPLRGFFK